MTPTLPGMGVSRVRRVAVVVLAAAAFSLPGAAWADTIASLDPADGLTTAGSAEQVCEGFGGGPVIGKDIWVFVLPGTARRFTSLTVVLTNGTHSAAADGGIADVNGTSKAWVRAPAGAALIDATALVTGAEPDGLLRFSLASVCPGGQATPDPSSHSAGSMPDAAKTSQDPRTSGWLLAVASAVTAIIGAGLLFAITAGAATRNTTRTRPAGRRKPWSRP